jgi:L-2-hydroxyglutarate oxidase LhgO
MGAGIFGLTIAFGLKSAIRLQKALIRKSQNAGEHASGRNSGVLQSGIFNMATIRLRPRITGLVRSECESLPLKME